jgi:hypothetical protein
MTTLRPADGDVERAVRAWLHEDRHEDVSRIAGAVLDQLDTTRQRRAIWWPAHRSSTVHRIIGVSLAAAVVVALLFGSQLVGRPAPGGVGAEPTTTPEPRMLPSSGVLDPATYRISDAAYTPVDLIVTIPAGWSTNRFHTLTKDADSPSEVGLAPDVVTHVYRDACLSDGTLTAIGPTGDDLIAALLAQRNVEVTGPFDTTLDGIPAQRLDLAPPPGLDLGTCSPSGEVIQIWANQPVPLVFMLAAGDAGSVYVADVDGQRVVIATATGPDATAGDIAERDAIIDSMRIEP